MAYIGIDPNVGDISFQTFTGDGSTTTFTLAQSVASGEAIIVTIGNVVQEPGASAAYVAYANTLTFSAAPASGDVITVRYFGRAVDQPLSYGMQLFKYVATASQTVFTGADSSGTVLAFSGTDVDVYLNGVHLDADDFTASSGDTITLAVGAALNDELVVRAFRAFTITDTVSASSGGTFNGAVNVNGTVTADGLTVDGSGTAQITSTSAATLELIRSGSAGQISSLIMKDGGNVQNRINSSGGALEFEYGASNTNALKIDNNGDISFYNTSGTAKFFWDASAERLGIGTIGPSKDLHIASTEPQIRLQDTNNASGNVGLIGLVSFYDSAEVLAGYVGYGSASHNDFYVYNAENSNTVLYTNGSPRMTINSSGNVGIGAISPADKLEIRKAVTGAYSGGVIDGGLRIDTGYSAATGSYGHNGITFYGDADDASFIYQIHNNNSTSQLAIGTNNIERLRIDSDGNVGIGATSPRTVLDLGTTRTQKMRWGTAGSLGELDNVAGDYISNNVYPSAYSAGTITYTKTTGDAGNVILQDYVDGIRFFTGVTGSGGSTGTLNSFQRVRITASGDLLVGTTDANPTVNNVVGTKLNGQAKFSVSGGPAVEFNRVSGQGEILRFRKDGSAVGVISSGAPSGGTYPLAIGYLTSGLWFVPAAAAVVPFNTTANNGTDNTLDFGIASIRWDDIYATNGTIQTSDANEKQQIAPLTDAEMTAAKAISALFKTYKWNSAVTEKGDAARTHAGVIAQDVQAAMTAAGLDAGDYAFFISSTWWETQTEVPAVKAADAVLDEDGNVVTEAVEAQEAYTRTDTYETAEEAPEGATERTRLGIRYPELLAFVGAATEQRLANIETRLAALEAN